MVIIAVLVAVLVGLAYHSRWLGLGTKPTASGVGSVQVLVDTHLSAFTTVQIPATDQDLDIRAPLYAEFGASSAATAIIASAAGVPPSEMSITADTSEVTDSGAVQSTSYNTAPAASGTRYRVVFIASNQLPIVTISTSAPTGALAARLAGAALNGLRLAAQSLEFQHTAPTTGGAHTGKQTAPQTNVQPATRKPNSIVLRAIGPAVGTTVVHQGSSAKAIEYAVAILVVLLLVILAIDSLWRRRQRRRLAVAS